jgi:hypothetical protein
MLEEFLGKVNHDDYVSDYWLFEDIYIKEVKYLKDEIITDIIDINEYLENGDKYIIKEIKKYKEV